MNKTQTTHTNNFHYQKLKEKKKNLPIGINSNPYPNNFLFSHKPSNIATNYINIGNKINQNQKNKNSKNSNKTSNSKCLFNNFLSVNTQLSKYSNGSIMSNSNLNNTTTKNLIQEKINSNRAIIPPNKNISLFNKGILFTFNTSKKKDSNNNNYSTNNKNKNNNSVSNNNKNLNYNNNNNSNVNSTEHYKINLNKKSYNKENNNKRYNIKPKIRKFKFKHTTTYTKNFKLNNQININNNNFDKSEYLNQISEPNKIIQFMNKLEHNNNKHKTISSNNNRRTNLNNNNNKIILSNSKKEIRLNHNKMNIRYERVCKTKRITNSSTTNATSNNININKNYKNIPHNKRGNSHDYLTITHSNSKQMDENQKKILKKQRSVSINRVNLNKIISISKDKNNNNNNNEINNNNNNKNKKIKNSYISKKLNYIIHNKEFTHGNIKINLNFLLQDIKLNKNNNNNNIPINNNNLKYKDYFAKKVKISKSITSSKITNNNLINTQSQKTNIDSNIISNNSNTTSINSKSSLEHTSKKSSRKSNNNNNIYNNSLLNDDNLCELPFDYDEKFDDLNAIVHKLKFNNLFVNSESYFSLNNKYYKNYENEFDIKFNNLKINNNKKHYELTNSAKGRISDKKNNNISSNYTNISFSTQTNSSYKKTKSININHHIPINHYTNSNNNFNTPSSRALVVNECSEFKEE